MIEWNQNGELVCSAQEQTFIVGNLQEGWVITIDMLEGDSSLIIVYDPVTGDPIASFPHTFTVGVQTYITFNPIEGPSDFVFSIVEGTGYVAETVYDYPGIIPAAVSSELDNTGEERIHIANKQGGTSTAPTPPATCTTAINFPAWDESGTNANLYPVGMTDMPSWLNEIPDTILIDFFDNGTLITYNWNPNFGGYWEIDGVAAISNESGRGVIYSADMSQSICFDWEIPLGV